MFSDKICCFGTNYSRLVGVRSSSNSGKGKSQQGPVKVIYGFSLVKGKASHPMEDYHVAKFVRVKGHELGLFAIYDGHLGDKVPAYLQKHLFNNILQEEDFWSNPQQSISRAYEKTDQAILTHGPDLGRGGSTAVTAIIVDGQKLWIANVGDSRAVLSRSGNPVQLTTDHEPNTERGSIETKGGFVSNMPGDVPRVNGQLAVSRAFGDKSLKSHLRSDPDIQHVDITGSIEFLVLASDGLWKVMSNEEVVDFARKIKDPVVAAKQLTAEAVNRESKDDISCIVVRFRSLCWSPIACRKDSLETAKLDTSSSLSLSKLHVSSAKVWIIVGLGVAGIILLSRRRRKSVVRLEDLGAFVDRFVLSSSPQPPPPAARLPLTDLVFAVKDVFDVKGYVTGFGNPDWKATHEPATRTAAVVSSLLKQGAACAGKTMMDEFALGFTGENKHYGTPMNPEEPSQIPGGSSSGSAVAVAGELVDFSLGTDTVGCVRIPAACCGILGFRPSHGSVPIAGVLQNSPSLDTIGWFAKDPSVLWEVGHVLLQLAPVNVRRSRRFIFGDDCFQLSTVPKQKSVCVIEKATEKLSGYQPPKHINFGQYLASAVPSLRGFHEPSATVQQGTSTLRVLSYVMALLQRYEFRVNHEEWFNKVKPSLGPDISAQVHAAMNNTEENIKSCYKVKSEMRSALNSLLKDDGILVVPTIPEPPPRVNSKKSSYSQFQNRVSVLMSLATLSGCCQVVVPLGKHDGSSISVSFIASYGGDKFLLDTVLDMYSSLREAADAASNLPPAPDTDGDMDTAELFKEKGNAAFKGRQWNKAVNFYTEAIKLNSTTATYYSNRAAAYLELGCFQQAESDCNQAILLDKKNVKAYLRRGTAREMLYFYKDAIGDFKHALVLEPQNKAALSATKRLKKLMG